MTTSGKASLTALGSGKPHVATDCHCGSAARVRDTVGRPRGAVTWRRTVATRHCDGATWLRETATWVRDGATWVRHNATWVRDIAN